MSFAYDFVPLRAGRSTGKPRATGLTMVVDGGIPADRLADGLDMLGPYLDLGKIKVGGARLYKEDYLRRKLDIYRANAVTTFPGGQFLEYALFTQGGGISKRYFAETARVGFTAVEISDNVVEIADDRRVAMIAEARDAGLRVLSEVGSKKTESDAATLIRQAELSLEAGADYVLVEAAELVRDGAIHQEMLDRITAALDMGRVIIELPGPWIPTVTLSLIDTMKKALVRSIGPDVNLGNIDFDGLFDLETLRTGLGTEGPPGMGAGG